MLTALVALSSILLVGWLVRHRRIGADSAAVAPDDLLRLAYESADLGAWSWRVGDAFVHTSDRWMTMLGYAPGEFDVTLEQCKALIHPDDEPAVEAAFLAHLNGESELCETMHRMRARDGSWRWILNRSRIVRRNPDGTPLLLAGTHLDITARKQAEAEEAIVRTTALQTTVMSAFPDLVFRVDREGTYLDVHAADPSLLFAPPEIIIGKTTSDLLPTEIAAEAVEKIAHTLATGEVQTMEYPLFCGDEFRHFEARIARFGTDEAVIVVRDVTDRVQQRLFLRQVIDTSPNLILVKDTEGRFVLANRAAADLFGRPLDELVGCRDTDLLPDAAEDIRRNDQQVLRTGESLLVSEQCLTDAAGHTRYFQTRKARMDGAGGEARLLVVAEDITARREVERHLAESEAWVNRVLTSITDGLYVVDDQWIVQMMNPQAEKLLERSAQDLVGKRLWDEFPSTVDTAFYHECHRAVSERVPLGFSSFYAPSQAWHEIRTFPFEGGLAVFFTDVTAQRAYEEALRLRQERMEFLHEVTSQPHVDVDMLLEQTLHHTATLLGMEIGVISRIEDEQYTILHAVHPPAFSLTAGDTLPLEDTYCSITFMGASLLAIHHVAESLLYTKPFYEDLKLEAYIGVPLVVDGAPFGTLCFCSTTPRESFGEMDIEMMHLLGQWVSGAMLRQQHSAAIAASEARFRLLAEKMTDLVCLHESDGTYRWVSPSMQTLLGYTPEEIIGKSPLDFIHPEDEASLRGLFNPRNLIRAARAGMQAEFRYRHRDGHYVWLEALGHLHLSLDGREASLQTTSRNITQRKRFEEQLERVAEDLEVRNGELAHARDAAQSADRAKSQFLANMSHEIRTPLNGIVGVSDLLRTTELTAAQQELVSILQTSSDTLLSLINDILDLSKIEAGHLELCPEPFRVRGLAAGATDLIRFKAKDKGLALHVEIDDDVPASVVGDENRLRQVLLNLLSNAVKFTHEGSVTLRVAAEAGHALTFSVTDTGIGISPEKQKELFQRFNQLDASTTKRYGGTGLGLAISQHLISMMDGEISVTSAPGAGTTFAFTIVLRAVQEAPTAPADGPALPQVSIAQHLAGKRLLAVEDNAVNRRVLLRILEQMGLTVDVALHGVEALEMLDETAYDLILMDVLMPEMDGLTCTREIRGRGGEQPWIIGLTANALEGDREEVLAAGMDDYVPKPIRRDVFEAALLRVPSASPRLL